MRISWRARALPKDLHEQSPQRSKVSFIDTQTLVQCRYPFDVGMKNRSRAIATAAPHVLPAAAAQTGKGRARVLGLAFSPGLH